MKPTVIIIVVVIAILGFLLFYSQQASTPADKGLLEQAAVSEPAQEPAAGSEGAAQDAPAAGGQSSAPSGEHSK